MSILLTIGLIQIAHLSILSPAIREGSISIFWMPQNSRPTGLRVRQHAQKIVPSAGIAKVLRNRCLYRRSNWSEPIYLPCNCVSCRQRSSFTSYLRRSRCESVSSGKLVIFLRPWRMPGESPPALPRILPGASRAAPAPPFVPSIRQTLAALSRFRSTPVYAA